MEKIKKRRKRRRKKESQRAEIIGKRLLHCREDGEADEKRMSQDVFKGKKVQK